MSEIVRYSALRKTANGQLLLDIDMLEIHEHSCVALSGRNGVGKSTLMRIIAGLESPDSVTVMLGGKALPWRRACQQLRTHVIYLHQQPYLFDRSVIDNIAYGLRQQKFSIKDISSKVSEALDWAGIARSANAQCPRTLRWRAPAGGICTCTYSQSAGAAAG